ncbi:hypothetical protein E4U59_000238 [Claviceps monticola]|nr:hypothetical protein E4U59_000238 [Claviceps monticola]
MRFTNRLVAVGGAMLVAATAAQAGYQLETTYDTTNFFENFDFFTGQDPTEGFVEYVNGETANKEGLAHYDKGAIYMGVDTKTMHPANGRKSVRVTSHKMFTRGLIIADIAHMPGSICGTWPAFWMFGPEWPGNGEIDILEGVNAQTKNSVTLHTKAGCHISNHGTLASTKFASSDCGAVGTSAGCGQHTADNQNYGDGFNAIGGGIYATEWTSDHIAVWFFPRHKIPQDIDAENPDPTSWGSPMARFVGGPSCAIDNHFSNHQIVIDTTFCGAWAGDQNVWGSDAECSALAKTCKDYVSGNPSHFADSYWLVNSIKVYEQGTGNYNHPKKPLPSATQTKTSAEPEGTPPPDNKLPHLPVQPPQSMGMKAAVRPQPNNKGLENGQVWNSKPQPETHTPSLSAPPTPKPTPSSSTPPPPPSSSTPPPPPPSSTPPPPPPSSTTPPPPPPPAQPQRTPPAQPQTTSEAIPDPDDSWDGQVWNGMGWDA